MDVAEQRPILRVVTRRPPPGPIRFPPPPISVSVALWLMVITGVALAQADPPTDVNEAVKFIRDVGFPIAVAGYVLVRMEATLRELTKTLGKLEGMLVERVRREDG